MVVVTVEPLIRQLLSLKYSTLLNAYIGEMYNLTKTAGFHTEPCLGDFHL